MKESQRELYRRLQTLKRIRARGGVVTPLPTGGDFQILEPPADRVMSDEGKSDPATGIREEDVPY